MHYDDRKLTEVSEEDLANAWTDVRGVKYSADKRRLLKAAEHMNGEYTILPGTEVICELAFCNCELLEKIDIPKSITHIGCFAFFSCSGLTQVTIPENVRKIGYETFFGCSGLTQVTIPENVTEISSAAFEACSGLTKFDVAEGNEYYCAKDGVLYSEDKTTLVQFPLASPLLPSFDIPEGVTKIGNDAFSNCEGLTRVTIPNSVTQIGENAFKGCGLTEVTIPESITSIGYCAFCVCMRLTKVNFNAKACMFAGSDCWDGAFSGCTNITTVNIGDNVTIIPYYLFYDCSGLTQVTIPKSVTKIGNYAFNENIKPILEI